MAAAPHRRSPNGDDLRWQEPGLGTSIIGPAVIERLVDPSRRPRPTVRAGTPARSSANRADLALGPELARRPA
jgi:hypothetical protein